MFIKIFCGDSQKYLLLQSTNVTLDKTTRFIHSDLYPIMCAYIDEMSLPVGEVPIGEEGIEKIEHLCDSFTSIAQTAYNDKNVLVSVNAFISDMFSNVPYSSLYPVLSEEEKHYKYEWSQKCCDSVKEQPLSAYNKKLSVIEVDGKTYITSGAIYIMNDDGKTIDRV